MRDEDTETKVGEESSEEQYASEQSKGILTENEGYRKLRRTPHPNRTKATIRMEVRELSAK